MATHWITESHLCYGLGIYTGEYFKSLDNDIKERIISSKSEDAGNSNRYVLFPLHFTSSSHSIYQHYRGHLNANKTSSNPTSNKGNRIKVIIRILGRIFKKMLVTLPTSGSMSLIYKGCRDEKSIQRQR